MNHYPFRGFFALGILAALFSRADNMILIKPTAPWSVTGRDDLKQLKHLASGVGWEFEPNAETAARLKTLGVKTIRCINVDPLPGAFTATGEFVVGKPERRVLAHWETCRTLGATPHVIIATGLAPELRVTSEDIPEAQRGLFGNQTAQAVYGPRDWAAFRRYCESYFRYILIDQKFPHARFEVANEPDIGTFVHPRPPKPANGSRASYEAYFNLYRNVAQAATNFEARHPGLRVTLGGPAIAWAFTFKFGDFNWAERFLRDCAEQQVKLDFIGLHFYGNISSLDGEYAANYPSFTSMLRTTQAARDRHCPGVPIWFTEWGPSFHTSNEPQAAINGNPAGAAWSAAFLNTLLQGGVEGALYLVTTDRRQPTAQGKAENVWGWPSLFVNPHVFGKPYPKAPYHLFDMISRLEGGRVEATRGNRGSTCFASADPGKRRLTILLWNYNSRIPETGVAVEQALPEGVMLRVREAEAFFGGRSVRAQRWLVSETNSNAYGLFQKEGVVDARAELQQVGDGTSAITDGQLDIGFSMPTSSVAFIQVDACADMGCTP